MITSYLTIKDKEDIIEEVKARTPNIRKKGWKIRINQHYVNPVSENELFDIVLTAPDGHIIDTGRRVVPSRDYTIIIQSLIHIIEQDVIRFMPKLDAPSLASMLSFLV